MSTYEHEHAWPGHWHAIPPPERFTAEFNEAERQRFERDEAIRLGRTILDWRRRDAAVAGDNALWEAECARMVAAAAETVGQAIDAQGDYDAALSEAIAWGSI